MIFKLREILEGGVFTDMLLCAAAALESNKQRINDLNVFPVPDGDTGTNMSMTMAAGANELMRQRPQTVGDVAKIAASALLRGARGNSGVILSLLFRGMAKPLKGKDGCTAHDLSLAFSEGVESAYNAVMKPAEGTILTVSRMAAAAAADFSETGTDIELMLSCALESAKDALAETINQNPTLKKAGVIDAGGDGYVIILQAMLACLRGEVTPQSYEAPAAPSPGHSVFSDFDTGEITFGYCTEFIINKENDKSVNYFREFLDSLGDSIVVVDDDEIINTHVHTNDPGRVLSEALSYGSLLTVKIENMREQHTELTGGAAPAPSSTAAASPASSAQAVGEEKDFGIVVVCAGAGMQALFKDLGADGIVTGGQTMNPSTEDILRAIEATPAKTVFVFPNNKNIVMAAQQCIPLTEKKVIVVPTKSVPQGVSALLNMDAYAQSEEEMESVARQVLDTVHTALFTYAARDSDFDGHEIRAGEYLALFDGTLLGSNTDIDVLLDSLSYTLTDISPEFITVYYGEDVDEQAAAALSEKLSVSNPEAEMNVINGGQPVYYYMISAE
jgi:DAK2 domain fusion protein YloV